MGPEVKMSEKTKIAGDSLQRQAELTAIVSNYLASNPGKSAPNQ
jgi:hypothetical protein